MIDMKNADFVYTATLKLTEIPHISKTFPGVTDLAVNSRTFNSYVECVASVRDLMESVVTKANEETERLTVSAEINPVHTGVETRSKDWSESELARIWIFEKNEEANKIIQALGQARVFACDKDNPSPLLN